MTPPLRLFDRYVLGQFGRYLLFSLLAAASIFVVVDLVEHLDTFVDKKASAGIVVMYYGYYLPYILYLVLPVATLLAALFTVGSLSRSHELTAAKASGIGLYRILGHMLALGILLSGANFLFGETVVPYTNKRSADIYRYNIKGVSRDQAERQGRIYLRNKPGEMVHLDHFDPKTGTVYDLNWERFSGVILKERLIARQAVWKDSIWIAQKAQLWRFYSDSAGVQRIPQQAFGNLGFTPTDLVKVQTNPEEMGYWQLKGFVRRLQTMGGDPVRWLVELAFKTAMPFTCAIVVLLGVPIAAQYRRSGMVVGMGIGLLISFVYFALQQFGKVMGYNGDVSPQLAAWLGNGVFILVGTVLYWKVGK